jgi:hypothetical protein
MGGNDEDSTRDKNSMDLAEHRIQVGAWEMVDRVEGHDDCERLRADGEHPHVAACEAGTTRAFDCEAKHLPGEIQSDHLGAMDTEVLGDLTGSTTEVEHWTHPVDPPNRCVKDGTVNGKVMEIVCEGSDIVFCD